MDAEQYAKWVWDYRKSGFWQKVNFEAFKGRLVALGISKRFWDTYKKYKGPDLDQQTEDLYAQYEEDQY